MVIRKYKKKLPTSLDAIRKMSPEELKELCYCYNIVGVPMAKPLWYKIMCEETGLSVESKHLKRLTKYANNPEKCIETSNKLKYKLKPGSQIEKTYKGNKYLITVCYDGRFRYGDKYYTTLSAVALDICNYEVSGNDFFGLNNKEGGIVDEVY